MESSQSNLKVLADDVEDTADRGSDGVKAQASNEASDRGSELDKESTDVLASDDEETFNGGAEVLDEVTDGGSVVDDLANGASKAGEAETAQETGNARGELDQELLAVLAGDGEDLINAGAEILDGLAGGVLVALDALAEGVDDFTDGLGERGEEAGDEALDFGRELDQESTGVLADDGEKVLDGLGEVLEEFADATGLLNDLADGNTDLGEAEAAQQLDDRGAELDEELLGVFAGDGEGGVDTGADVREQLAGVAAVLAITGDNRRDGLGHVLDARQKTAVVGRRGDGGGCQGGKSSEDDGLHFVGDRKQRVT